MRGNHPAVKTCVVHLVWKPLGRKYLERFLASYQRFSGGHEHSLVVLLNGFEDEYELAPYHDLLRGVEHQSILLPGACQDIAAYLEAARRCPCDILCFLNSYSELLDEAWLLKLHSHITRQGVGLAGASGSYESPASAPAPKPAYVTGGSPLWRARTNFYIARHHPAQRRAWERERRRAQAQYEPFPNPHLRTNGWMIARDLLLGLEAGDLSTKEGALAFESGRASLTRQVLARGLQVLVVGRDGRGYEPKQWFQSRTFRSGEQENLLISDNRTQQFAQEDVQERAFLARLAWGEEAAAEMEAEGAG